MIEDQRFHERLARIEALTGLLERSLDPAARAAAQELVGTLFELHRAGLAKMLELTTAAVEGGSTIVESFTNDSLVGNLLLLHGLHPDDLETRVRRALQSLRSQLCSHEGSNIELVDCAGEIVTLRLSGGCSGCSSSARNRRRTVEDALLAAVPDLAAIHFEDAPESEAGELPGKVLLPVISL